MKIKTPSRNITLWLAVLISLPIFATGLHAAGPLPLTDNQSPPYQGVWEPMYGGTQGTDNYAQWLNRQGMWPVVTQYYMDGAGWPARFDKYWVDPGWSKWASAAPGRRTVVIVALPTDSDSLDKGAKGGFNDKATAMAEYLVANNLANSVICMGLINNPNPWDTATPQDAANFVAYWKQIVTAIKAVPGADKLQFDWVGMNRKTSFPLESAWPGDAYVDYVGMILYDQCLDKSIYPYPPHATDADKLKRQKKAWEKYYYPAAQNGLEAWEAIAKAHHKPFSLPSWSLYSDHYEDGTLSTGEDNTYFIQQMHDFIQDPTNNVYFACYMDNYPHCTQISPPAATAKAPAPPPWYPNSTALFQKLFGLPAANAK